MGKCPAVTIGILLVAFFTAGAGEREKKPVLTFLDTLNSGREVSISAADIVPRAVQPATMSTASSDTGSSSSAAEPKREAGVVPSRFRIQVLASTQEQEVKKEKNTLAVKTTLPLSVIFDAPYYKLFAGDFLQRSEAESNCAQLKKNGYNDAWIVRTAAQQK
jgi:hypothetical protein